MDAELITNAVLFARQGVIHPRLIPNTLTNDAYKLTKLISPDTQSTPENNTVFEKSKILSLNKCFVFFSRWILHKESDQESLKSELNGKNVDHLKALVEKFEEMTEFIKDKQNIHKPLVEMIRKVKAIFKQQSVAAYKRATWRSGSRNRFTCPGNQTRPKAYTRVQVVHTARTRDIRRYSFTLVQVVHQGTRTCDVRRDKLTPHATSRDSGTTSMWYSQRPKTISPRCSHSRGSQEQIDHSNYERVLIVASRTTLKTS
ncbi:unnamed protein product [Trichogramma brassicae]|uniref:Uncharacterized protein n=1 Tax=Trichogramma brassicae TaxID=86971 RepID=A0A6H5IV67_9HYME|nr:unnamed protein product [Trichogramma brassicae]